MLEEFIQKLRDERDKECDMLLKLFRCQISDDICHLLLILTNYFLERNLYVKLNVWMSNSVDQDETAHYHLDLCCLQKPIIIACGSEIVNMFRFMYILA